MKNSWMQDPWYKHEYLNKFPNPLAMMMMKVKVMPFCIPGFEFEREDINKFMTLEMQA